MSASIVTDKPTLFTPKQTAEYLTIPVPTVYYLANIGKLPVIRIGGRLRFLKDALDRDILHLDGPVPACPRCAPLRHGTETAN